MLAIEQAPSFATLPVNTTPPVLRCSAGEFLLPWRIHTAQGTALGFASLVPPRRKPAPRWVLGALAIVLVTLIGLSWWLDARQYESTDDAKIDGHSDVVSSRITGAVLYVNPPVENN